MEEGNEAKKIGGALKGATNMCSFSQLGVKCMDQIVLPIENSQQE